MKFRVDRDVFAEAVAWAVRAVPARPARPIFAGLRLEAADGLEPSLSLAGTDLDVSGRVSVAADVGDPGTAIVRGRLLGDLARLLPNAPVDIETEDTRLRVRCGRASFELPLLPVEDYPQLVEVPEPTGSVPGPVLAEAVGQVAVAASREEERLANLSGVRIEVDGEQVTLVATDRYRLAVRTINWSPRAAGTATSVLVSARTLAETAKALAHADSVDLSLGQGDIFGVSGLSRQTTTRLIDGSFPAYRNLLPSDFPTQARVETAALIEAIKRVQIVLEGGQAVQLHFTGSELVVRGGAGDDAVAVDALECVMSGEPLELIAFNPTYLIEGLQAINQPVTNMAFTNPNKPAVLTGAPSFEGEAVRDYLYLLMPIRLSS